MHPTGVHNSTFLIHGFFSEPVLATLWFPAGDGEQASIQVFNMLAALMAPGLTSCVDWEDLRSVFRTHEFPSMVANGIWLQAEASFFTASAGEKKLIEDSGVIGLMPAHPIQVSSQIKLMNAIRQFTANDPDFVMITPYEMSSEPVMTDQIVPVLLLIAPTTAEQSYC